MILQKMRDLKGIGAFFYKSEADQRLIVIVTFYEFVILTFA